MKYTKEDLIKLESLVDEINELLSEKFSRSMVYIKQPRNDKLKIEIYEQVSSVLFPIIR